TPPVAALFRVGLTETEPLARAPAPPLRQLRAALARAVYPDTEQPQSDHEDPAEYRAGHEDLRGGRLDSDAEEGQMVALGARGGHAGGDHDHEAEQAQRDGDHRRPAFRSGGRIGRSGRSERGHA